MLAAVEAGADVYCQKPVSVDIEEGHISTASSILANLAQKTGRTLHWDAAHGKIVGDADANSLLRRPYANRGRIPPS